MLGVLLVCWCPTVSGQQKARPSAQEAPLPRKPFFGAQLGPVSKELRERQKLNGTEGVVLVRVLPRTTAAQAGFKTGDVILSVNDSKVADIAAFLGKIRTIRTGDTLTVEVVRDGERSIKKLTMREKPRETSDAYDIAYGQILSRGSRLRTILTRPKAQGRHPAVLLLQGYGCGTIDIPVGRPDQLRWLADDLTRHGYVVMRVDRPGSGDSEGGPCQDMDLETELDGYRQALKALKGFAFVDADNVFLFGYSLGGTTAPLIAVDEPVKGIAVYGTGSKTWFEALLEQRRYVMRVDGTTPAEADRQMNRWGRVFTYLLLEKMKPADVAEKHPDLRDLLKIVGADGDYLNGRHYRFHHQLAERSIDGAWAKVDADVLALWGKSDWACAGYFDEHIARLVNQAHPGRAKFVALDGTDHGFYRVPSPEDAFRLEKNVGQGNATWPEYNPVVLETLRGWLEKETGKSAEQGKPCEATGNAVPAGQPSEWDRDAAYQGKRHWKRCRWYTPPADRRNRKVYGRRAWCLDGAIPGNGVVENWFELLDSWYDTINDETGGLNGYRW
ncbi:MAG TPA: alpha/beta fold hydrolase [Gemmataceae bacterium]|nr:alpha/beta fold hydrolase [Gemmataceae bacterium]